MDRESLGPSVDMAPSTLNDTSTETVTSPTAVTPSMYGQHHAGGHHYAPPASGAEHGGIDDRFHQQPRRGGSGGGRSMQNKHTRTFYCNDRRRFNPTGAADDYNKYEKVATTAACANEQL